jgi:hypothetical protein
MQYSRAFISEHEVPRARKPVFQHLVDTYASETNKVGAVWSALRDDQLDFRRPTAPPPTSPGGEQSLPKRWTRCAAPSDNAVTGIYRSTVSERGTHVG